ncbi:MAG: DUF115 domain-containing protein [Syntrophomonadaceae bacterium]|nr:DUF115 domain-containing protein [Syntrophomonadaceae bacterium]
MSPEYSFSVAKEIYEMNIQTLREYYPQLAQRIHNNDQAEDRFIAINTKLSGVYSFRDKISRHEYYTVDNPVGDIKNQIEALKLKNTRLALFLGMGLGYELLYYLHQMVKEQNTVYLIVIEKEMELFKHALSLVNLVNVISNKRILLVIGEREEKLYSIFLKCLLDNELLVLMKAVNPVYLDSALIINKAYYTAALETFGEAASQCLAYYGNDPYDTLIGIENMLANLKAIIGNPGINLLAGKFEKKPAIVVASGPSLNKHIELLKGLEDKALIICADSTLKILVDHGIRPQLVASLERLPSTVEVISGLNEEEVKDVYYAACPVVPAAAFEVYPGPKVIVFRQYRHFDWLEMERGSLNISFSAGNMAYKIAETMGCDPIILVGQDLAFGIEGDTHARGSIMGERQEVYYKRKVIQVKGNAGKPVQTEWAWFNCIKGYESDVATNPGTVVNCSETGAFIEGTKLMSLSDAIDKYISEPFAPLGMIKQAFAQFSPVDCQRDIKRIKALLQRTIKDMAELVLNCKEGLLVCERYREDLENFLQSKLNYDAVCKQLPNMRNQIMSVKDSCFAKKTVTGIFADIAQSYDVRHNIELFGIPSKYVDKNLCEAEILLKQHEWFTMIGDLAGQCLNSLKGSNTDLA